MTTQYRVLKDGMPLKKGGVSQMNGIYERKEFDSPDITFASRLKTGWLEEYVESYADIEAKQPPPPGHLRCPCGNLLKIPVVRPAKPAPKPEPEPEPEPAVEPAEEEVAEAVEEIEENLPDPPPPPPRLLPYDQRGNMTEYWDYLPKLLDKEGNERRNVRQCPGPCKKEYRSKSEIIECCAE